MNKFQFALLICIVLVSSIFVGVTSALSASDAAVMGHISNASPKPGDAIFVTVTFQSYSDDPLRVLRVGFHGDWMGDQEFQGPNLMSNPVTVEAKGSYSTQFQITVPTHVSVGSHQYYVGVDGSDQLGNTFSWDSSQYTLQVENSSIIAPSPTENPTVSPTRTINPTPTSTDNPTSKTPQTTPTSNLFDLINGILNWLVYLIILVVAIIVALTLFIVLRGKKIVK